MKKKIMVFGVFDLLHEGHRHFLREAKKFGEHLVVVVARDSSVKAIKNQTPEWDEEKRVATLKNEQLADEVVLGDEIPGAWEVIKIHQPHVIVLGYDQVSLKETLEDADAAQGITFIEISAHEPHRFKSSFFRKSK